MICYINFGFHLFFYEGITQPTCMSSLVQVDGIQVPYLAKPSIGCILVKADTGAIRGVFSVLGRDRSSHYHLLNNTWSNWINRVIFLKYGQSQTKFLARIHKTPSESRCMARQNPERDNIPTPPSSTPIPSLTHSLSLPLPIPHPMHSLSFPSPKTLPTLLC